jgi:hypothetical protein
MSGEPKIVPTNTENRKKKLMSGEPKIVPTNIERERRN